MTRKLVNCIFSLISWTAFLALNAVAFADGPADNQVDSVRPIPPPGIAMSDEQRESLKIDLELLQAKIAELRKSGNRVLVQDYLPDVEIFSRAVELALNEDGFFENRDVDRAKMLLDVGLSRAESLAEGGHPWTSLPANGLTVRGFRSKLDGTVQPYGVVIAPDVVAAQQAELAEKNYRADVWCRGRSEKGLELQFLATRLTSTDPAPVPGVIMIHPFGRYCNANKLAGEVDTLEALDHALSQYPIDPQRVVIRGFSMGGAAAWHLAVHYPDRWLAANPGAGFSETPEFLKVFQTEDLKPAWYEQKLWQMYDCPTWARNLRMLPTVAYSGEMDRQKQAADVMAAACWNLPNDERFELTHVVAPNVAHKFDPVARVEVERRLAAVDVAAPKQSFRTELTFTTSTLKYNSAHWLTINSLGEHWSPATVRARVSNDQTWLKLVAANVTDLTVDIPADQVPTSLSRIFVLHGEAIQDFDAWYPPHLSVNEQTEIKVAPRSDGSWGVRLRRVGAGWEQVSPTETAAPGLSKKHHLQGPIDDAFMSPFLFVKPNQAGRNAKVDAWVNAEMQRAITQWHRQMRGDVTVKSSDELKPEDIANCNLILWGDPQSNATLGKVSEQLPIQWNADSIVIGEHTFDAHTHAPVMIYPNPLNPHRYIVLNSSFTYREYDYLNNARQVPKLPDWAIVDLTVPPDARWPGRIAEANFFGEHWELKKASQP